MAIHTPRGAAASRRITDIVCTRERCLPYAHSSFTFGHRILGIPAAQLPADAAAAVAEEAPQGRPSPAHVAQVAEQAVAQPAEVQAPQRAPVAIPLVAA